jgi:hypothetical protein
MPLSGDAWHHVGASGPLRRFRSKWPVGEFFGFPAGCAGQQETRSMAGR